MSRKPQSRPPADALLLSAWRSGDARAGDLLLRRHVCAVRRFVERRVPSAADDLVQATLLAAAQRKHAFRGTGSFRGYLLGVARHQVSRHLRSRRRDRLVLCGNAHDRTPTSDSSAREVIAADERRRQLRRALATMPDAQRELLTMHYWGELTTAEVALLLRIPRGTAKSRLRNAKEALLSRMQADPAQITGSRGRE
ncbi:MAG: RNA polymerase sigma factor [Myxococcota bacterium]